MRQLWMLPFIWQARRNWSQARNAQDREARLAAQYTPRERRAAQQAFEDDRAYRFTRDAMLDVLEVGIVENPHELQNIQGALDQLSYRKEAFGIERFEELEELVARVRQLPVRRSIFRSDKGEPKLVFVFAAVFMAFVAFVMIGFSVDTYFNGYPRAHSHSNYSTR